MGCDKYVHKLGSANENAAHLSLLVSENLDTVYPLY